MQYRFIWIVALIVMLNIILIPFVSNEAGLIVDEDERIHAYSFFDLIEDIKEEDVRFVTGVYYIAGLICALLIFIGALREKTDTCVFGSVVGIIVSLYLFYEFNVSGWYLGLGHACLTFGYYISFVGFVSILIATLRKS